MKKIYWILAAIIILSIVGVTMFSDKLKAENSEMKEKPKVYFTKDISPESMLKLYNLVNKDISGKVAVKVHGGEPNGPYILRRDMVKAVVDSIPDSTLVETNVYYTSPRETTEGSLETMKANGWTFAPIDILDADGAVYVPVEGGKHFKEIALGKNIKNYDSLVVLTHFKGHAMGGFGGSMKNIAIGIASGKEGKKQMHELNGRQWGADKELFMEYMAESAKATQSVFGNKIAYINVMNNLSVDCDCAGVGAAKPTLPDVGMLASTDLLAIDQASIDILYNLPEEVSKHLRERIESRKGLHQLEAMESLKMGSREYELIDLDKAE